MVLHEAICTIAAHLTAIVLGETYISSAGNDATAGRRLNAIPTEAGAV